MTPKKQEKIFSPGYAIELLEIAQGDLDTARGIMESHLGRLENGFFMVQQAIEKSLKAVLVSQGLPVPLVHDLGVLIAKLPNHLIPPFGYELSDLNQYAAIRRYELGQFKLTHEELKIVIEKGDETIQWCHSIVHSKEN